MINAHICGGKTVPMTDEVEAAIKADPDNPMNWCCYGAASDGPASCVCWRPVFSARQRKPYGDATMKERAEQCGDCAFRHDSAEWAGDRDTLDLAVSQGQFVCHQGMSHVVKWVHPSGMEILAETDAAGNVNTYEPRYLGSSPCKASGRVADLCAGWAARRRLIEAGGD